MEASMLEPRRSRAPTGTPSLDNLAIVYVVLNVLWTVVVLAASAALWLCRRHESIRKRNVGLTIAAVLCLQVYWAVNMMIYPLNGAYPCDLNFWVMSIYFPLGVALYQLQNVQLLSVSARQRDLRHQPFRRSDRMTIHHLHFWRYRHSWSQMTLLSKIYLGITFSVITQVSLNAAVRVICKLMKAPRRSYCLSLYSSYPANSSRLGSLVILSQELNAFMAGNGKPS